MTAPVIRTPLPGPEASRLIGVDTRFVSPSYTRVYPLVVRRARGLWVEDVDQNRFLDFTAGIAVTATGHCHPEVVRVIRDQAEELLHMSGTDFYTVPQIRLAEKLAALVPGAGQHKVYFGNSGAEAVEAAFKLARWHTKRELNLAFFGAFHGRTMGALSLTASKAVQKRHYNPLVPGITHVPYAYCYRCPYHLCTPSCGTACVRWLEDTLFRTTIPPEEVAAIFVEPIQGEGGYIVPPPEFHQELYRLTRRYGILLVADEVQTGMGRTGRMFAMEHFGVEPDIIALAKGLASGLPLGAMVARAPIMDWTAGSHASTFGGNPLSCQAALATIALVEQGLMENARQQGQRLLGGLRRLQDQREPMGDVRGLGLMVAVELVMDRERKTPAPDLRARVIHEAFQRGLLLLGCGENSVRFCPALTVSAAEVDLCLELFDAALAAAIGA
jgi:4-aminobutyrate aminotransferase